MNDSEMTSDACATLLESLEETVTCFVCKNTGTEHVKINLCKHSFCHECIKNTKLCPICGVHFTESDLVACPFETCYLSLFLKFQRLLGFVRSEITESIFIHSDNSCQHLNLRICDVKSLNRSKYLKKYGGTEKANKLNTFQKKGSVVKKLEINKRNALGETLLFRACLKSNSFEVERLLKAGANPNVKDNAGWTPLSGAVNQGHVMVVNMLLKHGAWVNTPSDRNVTPLMEAVDGGNTVITHILLEHGADINMRNVTGDTAISLAKTEEMKSMLANTKLIQHFAQNEPPETTPVVFCCNLSKEEVIEVQRTSKTLNFELKPYFTSDVTHIITETYADNTFNCNFADLRGILAGSRIVSYSWIIGCKEANLVIPSHEYQGYGTKDYPNTNVVQMSLLNSFKLYPKLFNGAHISLTRCYSDINSFSKQELIILVQESGAIFLSRDPDPENIPDNEKTVIFHSDPTSLMGCVSHIILYETNKNEPKLKYNMKHVKTLPISWFFKCIQTFSICDP